MALRDSDRPEIRDALERQLGSVRTSTWRRVRRHYMARTRSWFPTKAEVDVKAFLGRQVDIGSDETGLSGASTRCARGILRFVNQQLSAAVASSIQHLRSPSEAWEVGSSARDIESSLERFERIHDDSVKSFYAYISAPSSSDLLREHGFVGFDEAGEQVVRTESIHALNCLGFTAISQSSDSCKERLRLLRREEPEDLDASLDDDEERPVRDSVFGEGYCKLVVDRVNVVCQQRVMSFFRVCPNELIISTRKLVQSERELRALGRGFGGREQLWSVDLPWLLFPSWACCLHLPSLRPVNSRSCYQSYLFVCLKRYWSAHFQQSSFWHSYMLLPARRMKTCGGRYAPCS